MPVKFTYGVPCFWRVVFLFVFILWRLPFAEYLHKFSLKKNPPINTTGIFKYITYSHFLMKGSQRSIALGISEKLIWWRKSLCKVPGPQKYKDKFDPLRRWLIVYLSLLVSWSFNDCCQQECPFLSQSWHCWVQIKAKSDFLVSERVVVVGEGQDLSFCIFLLTVLSLSRKLSTRKLKQRWCRLNEGVSIAEWS